MKKSVIIIAEAGINHNGDINIAKQLVEVAASAKVDYVKFQTFRAKNLVSSDAKKAKYQIANTGDLSNQFDMLHSLELTHEDHLILVEHCNKCGIKFMSSAFDVSGLEYLDQFVLDFVKCPSGEITNYPYLRKLASMDKKIILSTGMSDLNDVRNAIELLMTHGLSKDNLTLLHCNTEYPTPYVDVNLNAMGHMRNTFNVEVGYSDHTLGIEVSIAAVALGATVIEKHFTLDRTLPGPDHKASLEPMELTAMVKGIRNIELTISGNGKKEVTKSEEKNIAVARKSIHTNKSLAAGTIITENDIIPLRPGDGISPMKWYNVIGKKVKVDFTSFEKLSWEELE